MKISIVTVAFNSENTIRDTIESVLLQNYRDIEYIIVDGSSTDRTLDIIKEYGSQIAKVISEPDCGIYDAMNKGIRAATGSIVGIINSDDLYHKENVISEIVESFDSKDVESVFADVRYVKADNLNKTVRYYSSKHFSPNLFRYGFMPAHPTFFTYKKFYDLYGYYKTDYLIAGDYELLIRFLFSNKLKYKYLPIVVMRMRTGGVSTASIKSKVILNKEIVRACRENGIYTNFPLLCFKYFIKIFEYIILKIESPDGFPQNIIRKNGK